MDTAASIPERIVSQRRNFSDAIPGMLELRRIA
jgi:hypothetical protein